MVKQYTTTYPVGCHVWVKSITDNVLDVPKACKILSVTNKQLRVIDDDDKEFWISKSSVIKELHPSSLQPLDNMVALGDQEEYSILRNLHIRFKKNLIYTYVGKMLVAVNPYKALSIYDEIYVTKYRHHNLEELPAHIYAISNDCLKTMRSHSKSQCIVISGESGAGKTESTKFIVKFLTSSSKGRSQVNKIEDQLVKANPLLEAFGNASTTYNDNSSRFGKFVVMSYDEAGVLSKAHIQHYLLEKSRVTQVKPSERNYHIFYQLLNGLDENEQKQLELSSSTKYNFLNQTLDSRQRLKKDDLKVTEDAMKTLEFTKQDRWNIYKTLAIILHLGNIAYSSKEIDNLENTEVKDDTSLESAYKLLQVDKTILYDTLSRKTLSIHGKKTVSPVTKIQAKMTKDGFSKTLYERLFKFIIDKINSTLSNISVKTELSIGILDIYGFEDVGINSFEQLCINYTNECLQQFFLAHIFKLEEQEHIKEGVKWTPIQYEDNENVLNLIGGVHPNCLLKLIDEQANLMTGSDETFLLKAAKAHSKSAAFVDSLGGSNLSFGVLHFAGVVFYEVNGFLEKNRNPLSSNWLQLISSSKNNFIKDLFKEDQAANNNLSKSKHVAKLKTVAGQYQRSLDSLMTSLKASEPYFIRCIKPNNHKKSDLFVDSLCCLQLRYAGLMATTKIRKNGYQIRYKYEEFAEKYRYIIDLQSKISKSCRKVAEDICLKVLSGSDYQFGKSKIFLKCEHEASLDRAKNKVLWKSIVTIQKNWRMFAEKKRFNELRRSAVIIQSNWRAKKERRRYLALLSGVLRLQACIKSKILFETFRSRRDFVIRLQARCKGFMERKKVKEMLDLRKKDDVTTMVPGDDIDAWITSVFNAAIQDDEDIKEVYTHRL
ncbi:unconventional myosin-VIIa [Nilaparvata lugens]|uniref:unconventional myosin-VIIa n=1 Tax=Nilaparvata lugens TaxID=108931 RepID=UPI00193D3635|nr:unconventional myosin-VIIa [Nilaparvata lugens]